jgi:hypothetical protein
VFCGLDFGPLRRERKHPCAANHATTTTHLDPWSPEAARGGCSSVEGMAAGAAL